MEAGRMPGPSTSVKPKLRTPTNALGSASTRSVVKGKSQLPSKARRPVQKVNVAAINNIVSARGIRLNSLRHKRPTPSTRVNHPTAFSGKKKRNCSRSYPRGKYSLHRALGLPTIIRNIFPGNVDNSNADSRSVPSKPWGFPTSARKYQRKRAGMTPHIVPETAKRIRRNDSLLAPELTSSAKTIRKAP